MYVRDSSNSSDGEQVSERKRVLFLCTGNSARSQMAEALLRLLGGDIFEVYSAGTKPAPEVNPHAITVLRELGCDTSRLHTKTVDRFTSLPFDLVVTVCDRAKQTCPFFPGAKMTLHWSLEDPAAFEGTESEVLNRFRSIRDEIVARIKSELL